MSEELRKKMQGGLERLEACTTVLEQLEPLLSPGWERHGDDILRVLEPTLGEWSYLERTVAAAKAFPEVAPLLTRLQNAQAAVGSRIGTAFAATRVEREKHWPARLHALRDAVRQAAARRHQTPLASIEWMEPIPTLVLPVLIALALGVGFINPKAGLVAFGVGLVGASLFPRKWRGDLFADVVEVKPAWGANFSVPLDSAKVEEKGGFMVLQGPPSLRLPRSQGGKSFLLLLKSLLEDYARLHEENAFVDGLAEPPEPWVPGFRSLAQSRVNVKGDGPVQIFQFLAPSTRHSGRALVLKNGVLFIEDTVAQRVLTLVSGRTIRPELSSYRRGLERIPSATMLEKFDEARMLEGVYWLGAGDGVTWTWDEPITVAWNDQRFELVVDDAERARIRGLHGG